VKRLALFVVAELLEWTETPERAFLTALELNNKFSLDGQDPASYAGCASAIGGLYDLATRDQAIYGNVRPATLESAKKNFNVDKYIEWVSTQQALVKAAPSAGSSSSSSAAAAAEAAVTEKDDVAAVPQEAEDDAREEEDFVEDLF
jgi:ribosomal protein L12E/L44/L45/RPP1/RPP2